MSIPRQRRRSVASWVLFGAMVLGWWWFLAPTAVGGHNAYVLVDGDSMEPMLHTGDLAVIRVGSSHAVGDLVVVEVAGGQNIHRLVSGSVADGWKTKGDNNPSVDPWTVPDADVLGRYVTEVPQFGTLFTWTRAHPLILGAVVAVLAVIPYLPWRRRRVHPALADALTEATREPGVAGRSGAETAILAMSGLATMLSLLGSASALASGTLATPAGLMSLGGLVLAGSISGFMLHREFDGGGVAEPEKSLSTLSGRLRLIDSFPDLDASPVPVASAEALRTLAENHRLPVLHRFDALTGEHEFLVITARHGSAEWTAPLPTFGAHSAEGLAARKSKILAVH